MIDLRSRCVVTLFASDFCGTDVLNAAEDEDLYLLCACLMGHADARMLH